MAPTPHLNAKEGDFAKLVLCPGDPLRAKHIAEKFFSDFREVNNVRNVLGYTGTYQGMPVSVLAHGMGIPSISIYANELYKFYDVETIIRVGSSGGIAEELELRDIVVATGACTDASTVRTRFGGYNYSSIPDFELTKNCYDAAKELGIKAYFGNIFSADLFYGEDERLIPLLQKMNILTVEMESAELYSLAAKYRKKALGILTVSDHIVKGTETTSEERQNTFNEMIELALHTGLKNCC